MKRILSLITALGLLLIITSVTLADSSGKVYLDLDGVIGSEYVSDSFYLGAEYGQVNSNFPNIDEGWIPIAADFNYYNLKGGYLIINNSALKFGATLSYMNCAIDYYGGYRGDTSGFLGGVIGFIQTSKHSSLEGFYDFPVLIINSPTVDKELYYFMLKFNYAFTKHFGASVKLYCISCQYCGLGDLALGINYLF